jgi:carbon storage regulator
MLVLTRRVGEEIVIAGNIRVTVVGMTGRVARLGITAPASIPVLRQELLPRPSEAAGAPSAPPPTSS